ncbi:F-box protein cpr30 [Phtheirospermum japonicum]|uniref:F-box protein cpr30 n=1 Tax=Phtheirospermum japonicum TaxID=374723 RepID=A0A830BLS0_9LAMI|nr:F-box protein cpr30 [Phtheirospermum japonicum]
MFLWNPTTRTWKKLPPIAVKLRQGFYYIWGFGYDESSDDYKVVGIFCVFRNEGLYESVVKIYSLRVDYWKNIEGFEGGVPLDNFEKFTSEKIYGLMSRRRHLDGFTDGSGVWQWWRRQLLQLHGGDADSGNGVRQRFNLTTALDHD